MADFPHDAWYDAKKNQAHEDLSALLTFLDQNQAHHKTDAVRYARLYGNLDSGLGPYSYNRSASNSTVNRVTLNVTKSCVDSLGARISKNKPRPLFLTTDGDFSAQRKAKLLQRYVDGVFYDCNTYAIGQQVFLDATVFGTGIMAIYRKGDKIAMERVFPHEVTIDDAEGMYGKPGNLYRRKQLPRTKVLSMFKKFKTEILEVECVDATHSGVADLIEITEAWHLASAEGEKDGRYVVTIGNATLVDEVYTHDFFPFVFLRLNHKLLGMWGCGIVEQLVGIQVEINRLLRNITQQMNLLSAPKVMVEAGSKVVSSHLNNEIGTILSYIGKTPTLWLPQTVHPEIFQQLERLVKYAYEITGVSQSNASSQKPAGLESGKALREYNDIESERFIVVGQNYESFFVEIAQKVVKLTKEIATDRGRKGFPVRLKNKKTIKKIDWSEIDLEEDDFIMQIFPVSSLPNSPAGRLQTVQELIAAGMVGPEDGISLLDYPDLDAVNNMLTAAVEDLDMVLEEMLDEGIYSPPEPMQNLELGLKRFQSAYLRARINKAPEENLELLRRWMADASDMLNAGQEQATAPDQPAVSVAPEATERTPPPADPMAQQQAA